MNNFKEEILEQIDIRNKNGLSILLGSSMKHHRTLNSMDLAEPALEFKLQNFLKGLKPILNEIPQSKISDVAVQILKVTFDVFDYELSKEECFVLYALRDLGKFRMKDSKLLIDLEKQWEEYPEYRVDKEELKYILKELKNIKIIEFRRGAIILSEFLMLH